MKCHYEKYKKKKGYKIKDGEIGDEVVLEPVGDV